MNLFKRKNELVVQNNLPTIPVRDLKEYLVRDFAQIQANEIEISNLNKEIERLEKIEIEHKATLITLEEFDSRIEREKRKNEELNKKNIELKETIKEMNEKINDCVIREKQAIDKINNCQDVVLKEYKKVLLEEIKNTKGNLSKKKICDIIDSFECKIV